MKRSIFFFLFCFWFVPCAGYPLVIVGTVYRKYTHAGAYVNKLQYTKYVIRILYENEYTKYVIRILYENEFIEFLGKERSLPGKDMVPKNHKVAGDIDFPRSDETNNSTHVDSLFLYIKYHVSSYPARRIWRDSCLLPES